MNAFDKISHQYKEKSLVQQKAALKLFDLLKTRSNDSIIDIGCGPGHITDRLRAFTGGRVTGVDVSDGMIRQAEALYPGIEFRHIAAEELDYMKEFDVAFCNSALQWFSDPDKAITAIYNSLKRSGKLGLACPATSEWGPLFNHIISKVSEYNEIKPIFAHWKNPWFHLPAKSDYRLFFEEHGFKTIFIEIAYEQTNYSIEEAFSIYLSGAANGFTGKEYYDIEITEEYIADFNDHVREEMIRRSKDVKIKVDFNRLYYIGLK
ncbi:MAG TPA: methyltransferase domain-containing protein [Candidatus Methanoperedenaceae archaeon]|nr:methyltransferase domain-containing protein [Candidatus Methanoperedenaceae archaeon]